ncbi:MAG: ABC transporter ATP-binding protein [Mycoplasma sp.]
MFWNKNKNSDIKLIEKLNKPHDGPKLVFKKDRDLAVDAKNVQKSFISGSIASKILKGVDIKINHGEFVVILGPSGSGKTTLMNIISGLDRATSGQVDVLGNCLINMNDDELTKFRRINVGYIFQQYGLIPNLKVKENISVGSYLNNVNKKEVQKNKKFELKTIAKQYEDEKKQILDGSILNKQLQIYGPYMDVVDYAILYGYYTDKRLNDMIHMLSVTEKLKKQQLEALDKKYKEWNDSVVEVYLENSGIVETMEETIDDIMKTLDIYSIRNKYPNQLSGGQQQRVSIARVFAKKPKILFADEPTGAVDNSMSDVILNAFVEMNRKYNITIIIVTHNPEIAKLATKVVNFKDGYIESIIEQ